MIEQPCRLRIAILQPADPPEVTITAFIRVGKGKQKIRFVVDPADFVACMAGAEVDAKLVRDDLSNSGVKKHGFVYGNNQD